MTRPSEEDLIARYFASLALHAGAHGLKDDAALVTLPPGQSLVVTVDALVAGIHFLPDDPPDLIARKALRVNLSDLAAKGAVPHGFLLSLALPDGWTEPWITGFAEGLRQDVAAYGFPLFGGDTVRTTGPLSLSVTAFGLVAGEAIPRRTGAKVGHGLYVTGTIGDGALGLAVRTGRDGDFRAALTGDERDVLKERYLLPRPRVGLAGLVHTYASASMDISDGFVGDLLKLLCASGVSARIDLADVPLSPAARAAIAASPKRFETALTGGDDYELLLAIPAEHRSAFESHATETGIVVTRIGEVVGGTQLPRFLDASGAERHFRHSGFSHF